MLKAEKETGNYMRLCLKENNIVVDVTGKAMKI